MAVDGRPAFKYKKAMNKALKSVVIVGNDEHAWSAAVRLGVALKPYKVTVTVLEPSPLSMVHGLLSFGSSVHAFHRALGLSETDLIKHVGGAYKYGERYQNWVSANGQHVTYTYSPSGQMINRVQFHDYLAHLRLSGKEVSLESFSIAAMAATENRFTHPEPNSPYEKIDYSLNLDRARYVQLLRHIAQQQGIYCVQASIASVERCSQHGTIRALGLNDGSKLEADFYFDCTQNAQIIGDEFSIEFESWAQWFPYDRCVESLQRVDSPTPLFNVLAPLGSGWCKRVSAPGVVFQQAFFCSDDADDAARYNESKASMEALTQLVGARASFWQSNCVAIGAAAGNAGCLLFDDLHFTHTAIERWLALLPNAELNPPTIKQYNDSTKEECQRVRDVHALCLASLAASDSKLKERLRDVVWPDSLMHRVELFRATGRVAFYEADVLEKHQWVNLLIGFGVWPEKYDVLADSMPLQELEKQMAEIAGSVQQWVAKLPQHDALLNAIRASNPSQK